MGYSRKNPNKRIEGTEFPGYLGYRLWIFQGFIKKEVGFLVVIKKKLCGISTGADFWLGISKGVT